MAPPTRSEPHGAPRRAPQPLRVAALIYTCFVAYGCLVPFDFTPTPWANAWAVYRHIPEFHPGPFSRTDFTANVLLFLPLGFLWAGAFGAGRRRAGEIALAAATWIGAVLFQASLEFAQIYTPPRNVSLWDVVAGGVGAAFGLAAWLATEDRVRGMLARWSATRGRRGVAGWLVAPYAIGLLLYDVLPADLTLNAAALYRKWERGLVRPVPFQSLGDDPVTALFGIASEALLWLPIALLLVLGRGWRRFSAWGVTVLFAVGIEALQLLVQSRVSDSTDILCAAAGAAVGVWLGGRLRTEPAEVDTDAAPIEVPPRYLAALLAAIAWSGVLVFGFCYPFDFHYQASQLHARIEALTDVPFRTYWLATEARAVSDLLLQLVLFAPFGAVAAWVASRLRAAWAGRAAAATSLLVAGAVAAGIEALQVFLPGKVPDSTDIVVGAIGGLAGFFAARALLAALARPGRSTTERPRPTLEAPPMEGTPLDAPPRDSRPSPGGIRPLSADDLRLRSKRAKRAELAIKRTGIAYFLLVAFGFFAAESGLVSYNVRELFQRGGMIALIGFPFVALAMFAPPMLFSRWCARGEWRRSVLLPVFVLVHGIVVWIGLRVGVPLESIHDVVGAPVLGWWGDLEIMLRFFALFAAISTLYVGGAHVAATLVGPHPDWDRRALGRWIFMAAPILLVSYAVVVMAASTDNLTELMAGRGHILAAIGLATWIGTLATSASVVAAMMRKRAHLVGSVVILALGLPLGWMLLTLGTENAIDKYGEIFSATQFLFSTDRKHYASGFALVMRYGVAHASLVLTAALVQMPFAGRRHNVEAERGNAPLGGAAW